MQIIIQALVRGNVRRWIPRIRRGAGSNAVVRPHGPRAIAYSTPEEVPPSFSAFELTALDWGGGIEATARKLMEGKRQSPRQRASGMPSDGAECRGRKSSAGSETAVDTCSARLL